MSTLIYQCWTGPMRSGVQASMDNISAYAKRIGAEYRFDKDPHIADKHCDVPAYFEWLNPMLDESFWDYDQIACIDMDVFAVEGLDESLFDAPIADVGICTEASQPAYRATLSGAICRDKDEKWAKVVRDKWGIVLPRNEQGLLKVYNAGVVVFSQEGLHRARRSFLPFQVYIDAIRSTGLGRFYSVDQNYFHAQMVAHLAYTELDNGWNSYVHYVGSPEQQPRPVNDTRTASTRLVHIQLRGADDYNAQKLWRITNRPMAEW